MAIQKPEWFKVDAAKFLSDGQIDAMSTLELGACFRLLCRQWLDGYITDDLHVLARLCRLDAVAMGEAWLTLEPFFPTIEPGKRANRFMWIEREKVVTDLERRSDEGTRAARKRWDEARKKPDATPHATPNGSPMPEAMQEQTRADQSRPENKSLQPEAGASGDSSHDRELDAALREVWSYYLKTIDRNPKTYTFTDLRKRKGRARLRECLQKTGGILPDAVSLMKFAVDGLAADDWLMGRDQKTNGKRYCEWEDNLFKSYEQMEKLWNRLPESTAPQVKPNGSGPHLTAGAA